MPFCPAALGESIQVRANILPAARDCDACSRASRRAEFSGTPGASGPTGLLLLKPLQIDVGPEQFVQMGCDCPGPSDLCCEPVTCVLSGLLDRQQPTHAVCCLSHAQQLGPVLLRVPNDKWWVQSMNGSNGRGQAIPDRQLWLFWYVRASLHLCALVPCTDCALACATQASRGCWQQQCCCCCCGFVSLAAKIGQSPWRSLQNHISITPGS